MHKYLVEGHANKGGGENLRVHFTSSSLHGQEIMNIRTFAERFLHENFLQISINVFHNPIKILFSLYNFSTRAD